MSSSSGTILWLRNDLRLKDQPLLHRGGSHNVVWLYVFDVRFFSRAVVLPGGLGQVLKASARRALFVLQSVKDLADSLHTKYGIKLVVRLGQPEEVIPSLIQELGWSTAEVHCQRELGTEEESVQNAVCEALKGSGSALDVSWGAQWLFHPEDVVEILGLDPSQHLVNPHHFWTDGQPDPMVCIREARDEDVHVSRFLSALSPELADPHGLLAVSEKEALTLLGYSQEEADVASAQDPRSVLAFRGGETQAIQRLRKWITSGLRNYYEDRSGVLGEDYSSKMSPWIAHGCISPATVYWQVRKAGFDDSIQWYISELAWRDLFRFHMLYHGPEVFKVGGPAGSARSWKRNSALFRAWQQGTTGIPYVDAHMRELLHSGFMSNAGRQLVAGFFTCCLGMDWRLGAMWFESCLLDHDVALNYGNWNREARVRWKGKGLDLGSEPASEKLVEEGRQHLSARLKGALRGGVGPYDTQRFIRLWLPELENATWQELVCRSSPPPIFEVLCTRCQKLGSCARLVTTGHQGEEAQSLLCAGCRGACLSCGAEEGLWHSGSKQKREQYCRYCWDSWSGA